MRQEEPALIKRHWRTAGVSEVRLWYSRPREVRTGNRTRAKQDGCFCRYLRRKRLALRDMLPAESQGMLCGGGEEGSARLQRTINSAKPALRRLNL